MRVRGAVYAQYHARLSPAAGFFFAAFLSVLPCPARLFITDAIYRMLDYYAFYHDAARNTDAAGFFFS